MKEFLKEGESFKFILPMWDGVYNEKPCPYFFRYKIKKPRNEKPRNEKPYVDSSECGFDYQHVGLMRWTNIEPDGKQIQCEEMMDASAPDDLLKSIWKVEKVIIKPEYYDFREGFYPELYCVVGTTIFQEKKRTIYFCQNKEERNCIEPERVELVLNDEIKWIMEMADLEDKFGDFPSIGRSPKS